MLNCIGVYHVVYTHVYSHLENMLLDLRKAIVQQGMNHDKPYFSNMSDVNMLIFMANYYSFL